MARPASTTPTAAELEILKVLWREGPLTVRQVHEALHPRRRTGYTTTLKQLLIMTDKGLVERDERPRRHIYRAKLKAGPARRRIVADLLDRVFDGSAHDMLMHALSARPASADERRRMLEILNHAGEGQDDERGDDR